MNKRPVFPYNLEMHLVDHCNLNCKGCSHFAPLVKDEVFLSVEDFKNDLLRFNELFSDVYEIRLMGGEPLLHPEIPNFIKFTRQIFPKSNIAIFTNGLFLENMTNDFWKTCQTHRALIKITHYPISLNIKAIKKLGKAHNVGIKIPKQVNSFYKFINIKGDSNPESSFRTCRAVATTPFLRDGKLYTCALAPHIHLFNHYFGQDIPVSNEDYIDIFKEVSSKEILDFLKGPIPLCRWCNSQRVPFTWGRTNRDIQEWVNGETNNLTHIWFFTKKRAISLYHQLKHAVEIRSRNKK